MVYWVKKIDIWGLKDKIRADAKKPGFYEKSLGQETRDLRRNPVSSLGAPKPKHDAPTKA